MQVMSTSSACILAQQGHPDFLADDYVIDPLDYGQGRMTLSQRPGIGVEIDPVKLARYRARFEEEGMASIYPTSNGAPVLAVPAF